MYFYRKVSSFHQRNIMYLDEMVHVDVSAQEKCPLIGGVVKDRDHCRCID